LNNNSATPVAKASAQAMWQAVADPDLSGSLRKTQDRVQELLNTPGTVVVTSGVEESLTLLCGTEDPMYTAIGDPLYALTRPHADSPANAAKYGFLSAVNEEYGLVYDISAQAKGLKRANPDIVVVLDITQAVGRLDLRDLPKEIDAVVLDSRTCYCGPGAGALWVRDENTLLGRMSGGFQQRGFRPGMVSPILAAGFAAGLQMILEQQAAWFDYISRMRAKLDHVLEHAGNFSINYRTQPLVCNTSNFHIPGIWTKPVVLGLRRLGITVSDSVAGLENTAACTPLTAQLFEDEARHSNLRISLSALNTEAEVMDAAKKIIKAVFVANSLK